MLGDLVYVNYNGRVEDFQKLERELSINLTGKIAIARYGKIYSEETRKMNCATIQELENHFLSKLESLSTCVDLASVDLCMSGSECREKLVQINGDLGSMDSILMDLRRSIKKGKEELAASKGIKDGLDELLKDLNHMKNNLPTHLQPVKREEGPILQDRHIDENTYVLPQLPKQKGKVFPRIDFLTSDEFNAVPKYMKGRMSYEQLNSMVEVINETIRKKYQLMSKAKNQISEKQMKLYIKYKEQINKDTKRAHFFTTEDLTKYCSLKNDASVRSRLTILRHCTRLREVRGGGLTRYVVIE